MKVENRKARFEYEVVDEFEAGIALLGGEVKSVAAGRVQLEGSYVVIRPSPVSELPEAWLVNANIAAYEHTSQEMDVKRSRKLLLHRKELFLIEQKMKEGRLTIVPLSIYTTGRLVKLKIGLARGRKTWQKRELLKKRDVARDTERELHQR